MSIKGNTVGTPTPRPNWEQTDPRKADYIVNKPQNFKEVVVANVNVADEFHRIDVENFIPQNGVHHLTLVLNNDVIFNGQMWYGFGMTGLFYFDGENWVDTSTLNGIGYSKGQSMDIEYSYNEENYSFDYIHILNLPSDVKAIVDEALGVIENGTY